MKHLRRFFASLAYLIRHRRDGSAKGTTTTEPMNDTATRTRAVYVVRFRSDR